VLLSRDNFFANPCVLCSFVVMTKDEQYMFRCLELAKKGAGTVAPNPLVGAILVYNDRIIGEGFHQVFGGPHAEVNCLGSVAESDRPLIQSSTLYVSLEPCAHHGKTPPCADMIIRERIPAVVIGCRDPFPLVDGKGIDKLDKAGVVVKSGILEAEAKEVNKRFFTFHLRKRPYIILKWAQTSNGMISGPGKSRIQISNTYTNRMVHHWRSMESAILVGTQTALLDDPQLTSRIDGGKQPVRLVIDRDLRLPHSLQLFNTSAPTIVFNSRVERQTGNIYYCLLDADKDYLPAMLKKLHSLQIQSVLVEGGKVLLDSFLKIGLWDEVRRISATDKLEINGYPAPGFAVDHIAQTTLLENDRIDFFAAHHF